MLSIKTARRKRLDAADSGVLSDIAFLLIIFFIVIAVFNVNRGFLLGLPRKNSVSTVFTEDLLRLQITEDNRFFLAGEPVDLDELSRLVRERRQVQPNMTLVVSLHPEAAYQSLVRIVEIARVADVDNFSFSMDTGDSPTGGISP